MYEMRNLCPGPKVGERGERSRGGGGAPHRSNCLELVSPWSETAKGNDRVISLLVCLFFHLLKNQTFVNTLSLLSGSR